MIVTCENCSSRFVVDPKVLQPRGRRVRCARCKSIWFQAPPELDSLAGDADMRQRAMGQERRQVFQRAPAAAQAPQEEVFPSNTAAQTQSGASSNPPPSPAAYDDPDTPDEEHGDAKIEEDLAALYGEDTLAKPSGEEDMDDLPWGKPRQRKKSQVPALYKERSPILAVAGWAAVSALLLSALGTAIFARETIAAKLPSTKPVYAAVGLHIEPKVITENVARYLSIETPPPEPAYWRDELLIQEIKGSIINIADAPVRVPTLEGILRDRDNNELYRWLFSAEADILYPGQRAAFATEIVDLPQEAAEMELVFAEGRRPTSAPVVGSGAGTGRETSSASANDVVERSR